MFIVYLLQWWYGAGWRRQIGLVGTRVSKVAKAFSGGTLLRTLFSPWKQLVAANERDAAINDKFRAMLDNLVSRFVGFSVRSITLVAALFTIVFVFVANLAIVIVWPFVPLLPIACVVGWRIL